MTGMARSLAVYHANVDLKKWLKGFYSVCTSLGSSSLRSYAKPLRICRHRACVWSTPCTAGQICPTYLP